MSVASLPGGRSPLVVGDAPGGAQGRGRAARSKVHVRSPTALRRDRRARCGSRPASGVEAFALAGVASVVDGDDGASVTLGCVVVATVVGVVVVVAAMGAVVGAVSAPSPAPGDSSSPWIASASTGGATGTSVGRSEASDGCSSLVATLVVMPDDGSNTVWPGYKRSGTSASANRSRFASITSRRYRSSLHVRRLVAKLRLELGCGQVPQVVARLDDNGPMSTLIRPAGVSAGDPVTGNEEVPPPRTACHRRS